MPVIIIVVVIGFTHNIPSHSFPFLSSLRIPAFSFAAKLVGRLLIGWYKKKRVGNDISSQSQPEQEVWAGDVPWLLGFWV